MDHVPYQEFVGFENVYLEDSYVLDIRIKPRIVKFSLLVVLTEQHSLYTTPPTTEQYSYRQALLQFTNVERVTWVMESLVQYTDAEGEVDYGNIDEFFFDGKCYHLSGDWGKLEVKSSPPKLEILS